MKNIAWETASLEVEAALVSQKLLCVIISCSRVLILFHFTHPLTALMHAAHYILFNRWWPSDATALSYLVAFAHDKNYTAGIVALFDALGVSLVSLVDGLLL